MNRLISIIVPVYNEEENIRSFHDALINVLDGQRGESDYEIVFVNDGSGDESAKILQNLAKDNRRLKYIEFSRNFGKEIALTAGLDYCSGDVAIMIDTDFQHPPELIPKFLEKWKNGAQVVVGVRIKNRKEGLVKKIGSILFYKIIKRISETKIVSNSTDYRLLDRIVIDEFRRLKEKNRITRGLIDWLGFDRDYIYFEAPPRHKGEASYSFLQLLHLAFSSVISLSLFPLKLAGYLGIFITLIASFLILFILFENYFFSDPLKLNISPLATLAVFNLLLIGIVLICLGLVALYVASIHKEIINRPLYVIKRKNNFK